MHAAPTSMHANPSDLHSGVCAGPPFDCDTGVWRACRCGYDALEVRHQCVGKNVFQICAVVTAHEDANYSLRCASTLVAEFVRDLIGSTLVEHFSADTIRRMCTRAFSHMHIALQHMAQGLVLGDGTASIALVVVNTGAPIVVCASTGSVKVLIMHMSGQCPYTHPPPSSASYACEADTPTGRVGSLAPRVMAVSLSKSATYRIVLGSEGFFKCIDAGTVAAMCRGECMLMSASECATRIGMRMLHARHAFHTSDWDVPLVDAACIVLDAGSTRGGHAPQAPTPPVAFVNPDSLAFFLRR